MQSVSVFSDTAKFADFRWKSADISTTQGACQVNHLFSGFSLSKVQLCQVSEL